jgi:hypothetical protein
MVRQDQPRGLRTTPSLLLALALTACARPPAIDTAKEDAAILARLNHRLGPDPARGLGFRVRRTVKGERVMCGYTQSPRAPPVVLIYRSGCLFFANDLPGGAFSRWQDRFCGPDWVKPVVSPAVS